jgi:hypothetical protein
MVVTQKRIVSIVLEAYFSRMKTLTVREAEGQLASLIKEAHAGNVIVLKDGDKQVWLAAEQPLDLDEDSPELEAELLKAIDGPYAPHVPGDLRKITEQVIREKQGR